jgi:hypothetical protein
MEVKVRAAMQGNFATLTSVPDHVAFVATTSEYQIKNLLTLADLKDAIKENGGPSSMRKNDQITDLYQGKSEVRR